MLPSLYRELPKDRRACFGVEACAACGACAATSPELARLCFEIRAGTSGDGYIKIKGHDPIRVFRDGVTGAPVYQVEPEAGPAPPFTDDIRRALIFAERADYEPPALFLDGDPRRLFPDSADWIRYPELFANERPTKTAKREKREKKRPTILTPASDTLF